MKWQPFIQFRTGYAKDNWDKLTPAQQKEIYTASGKKRKQDPPAVEEDECNEVSWLPTLFPIRVVSRTEFEALPRFELFW